MLPFGMAETKRFGAFAGFAFYWAWVCLVFYSGALAPGAADAGAVVETVWLWSTWAHMASLLLFAVLARAVGGLLFSNAALRWLGSFGMAIGTVCVPIVLALSGDSFGAVAPLVAASGVIGVSSAWHVLQWGSLYATLPRGRVLVLSLVSMGAGLGLYFVFMAFPAVVGTASVVLLPLCSGAAAAVCRSKARSGSDHESERQRKSTGKSPAFGMVLPVVALFVFALCGEMLREFSISLANTSVDAMGFSYLAGGLVGLAALLAYCLLSRTKRAGSISLSLVRTTLLLMAAAFLVAPFLSGYSLAVSYGVFGAGFWCFRAISWALCFSVIDRLGSYPVRVVGVLDGAFALSVVISAEMNSWLAEFVKVGGTELTTVSLITVFVLMFMAMVVLNGKGIRAVLAVEAEAGSNGPASSEDRSGADEVSSVVRSIAAERGLTPRETEVVLLLARGRSLPYVQGELFISAGTAQTHARHIYKKLGIHSRQELIDLVEGRSDRPEA